MITHHAAVFSIGPIELTGFGLAVAAAFWIAQHVTRTELARRGDKRSAAAMSDLTLTAMLGTIVGAKLYYVVLITHDVRSVLERGGFVYWGGFIGAVLATAVFIRRRRLSFTAISDVAGIGIAAGYAIGRTGCWAVGDDYGRPWSSRWAVRFPEGAPASTAHNLRDVFHVPLPGISDGAVLGVYPTQLLEVVLGFAMFMILWRFRRHGHASGWLFGLYGLLAGSERFAVEFLRAKDDRVLIFGLSGAQGIALTIAILGAGWMLMRRRSSDSPPEQQRDTALLVGT